MKQVYKIDNQSIINFLDSIVIESGEVVPKGYVEIDTIRANTDGAPLKYKSEGTVMSESELNVIKNAPHPMSEMDNLKQQIADIQLALADMWGV